MKNVKMYEQYAKKINKECAEKMIPLVVNVTKMGIEVCHETKPDKTSLLDFHTSTKEQLESFMEKSFRRLL